MPVYLDANASEPIRPKALEAALEVMRAGGNPSSVHSVGRSAFGVLEKARRILSEACGFDSDGCIFTSGASEANALALHRLNANKKPYSLYCIGAMEHPSLHNFLATPQRIHPEAQVYEIAVDKNGQYHLDALGKKIDELDSPGSVLMCLSVANSETGILADLEKILEFTKTKGVDLHLDATQALGRGWVPPKDLAKYASLAVSGHKMGGIQGSGALLLPQGVEVQAVIPGNGQELGRRKGTQPLAAISSMATALIEARKQDWERIAQMRDALEDKLEKAGGVIIGKSGPRLPNTISIAAPQTGAQLQLMKFDMKGFAVSAGSACSSGKTEKSHVLEAMGYNDLAGHTVRVSLPWNVEEQDLVRFVEVYTEVLSK